MASEAIYQHNASAFRRLQPSIDAPYSRGELVAITAGSVVAHASSVDALQRLLSQLPIRCEDVFVVRAGEVYPEHAAIFV